MAVGADVAVLDDEVDSTNGTVGTVLDVADNTNDSLDTPLTELVAAAAPADDGCEAVTTVALASLVAVPPSLPSVDVDDALNLALHIPTFHPDGRACFTSSYTATQFFLVYIIQGEPIKMWQFTFVHIFANY